MNCRDFQNEFEERATLSQTATLHLDSCANCRKLHFEQTRLWEMLGGLQNVEAPKDFNFQLKARIARSKPGDYQTAGFFPALRYVLPLSAVLVVLSIVALSGLYSVNQHSVTTLETSNPAVNVSLPINSFVEPTEVALTNQNTAKQIPANLTANKKVEVTLKQPEVAENTQEGGSRDFVNPVKTPINLPENSDGNSRDLAGTSGTTRVPKEFDPNRPVDSSVNPQKNLANSLDQTWITIGIKTESFRVVSVNSNSIAERSGIKIGDRIEAINNKKIEENLIKQNIIMKTLTILRDGKRQEITLQNK